MTSLREAVRRRLGLAARDMADPVGYTYAVHWTKTARVWDREQRERARLALLHLTRQGDFEATTQERRYIVKEVDDIPHAGASLIALLGVLDALDHSKGDPPEEHR